MNSSTSEPSAEATAPAWGVPLALAALIFCVYFLLSMCSTIWDRDEARFARATAEMVSSGNYLFPTFNGKLRPDKPILIYWLMSVPVHLVGHTEWAYRLCSVLGTTLACLFSYSIGRSLFNHRTGLWAMMLLATNPLMAYTGAVATSDAVLLAFITGMFAVFADSLKSELKWKHVLALTVLFAGGLLTKGPVAWLPLIPFVLTRILLRRQLGSPVGAVLKILASLVVAGFVFAAWFYPANQATHGDLYEQMFLHHVVERMERPLENHGGYSPIYLGFYFLVILATFFPWTLYLPAALARLDPKYHKNGTDESPAHSGRVLLFAWIVTFLVVMIAISTKLPHYILPIWPALALTVGAYLDSTAEENATPVGTIWMALGGLFFLAVAVGVAAGIGFGPEFIAKYAKKPDAAWLPFANDSHSLRSVLGALCLIVAIPVVFRQKTIHAVSNARILLAAALLFFILADCFLLPSFERVKISAALAQQIRSKVAADTPVTVCGYSEASLIFYLNRNVSDIVPAQLVKDPKPAQKADPQAAAKKVAEAVSDWALAKGPGVLVIPKTMYEKYRGNAGIDELVQIGDVNGFNYSKGSWVDVLAFRRRN